MTVCQPTQQGTRLGRRVARGWSIRAVSWISEARSHRVICLVCGIWLLNFFDLAFTLLSHQQGVLQEQNPLARQMLQNGAASIALYKVGLVLIGTYPLLKFRTARIAEMASMVVLLAYATLSIRWSACYDLYVAAFSGDMSVADLDLTSVATPH